MRISLKAARVNKGYTQKEFAALLDVTKKTVSAWEKYESHPRADKIDSICRVLDVPYDNIKWTS